ncbi:MULTISPECIES: hypothetical protein [unclassified Thioalkalivibrio]|uniref:hypothetical protein n=1 Tax=unclassified Thioalkalivibrio TaxID=2621013 RepID=UPI00036E95DA|nr:MULTISPECIES: hypothetical protein [unclassified Thioalkalivibrio]
MLDALRLTLALGTPWLAASLLLLRVWPAGMPGRWPGVLGAGYFLGMLAVAAALLVAERLLGEWHYPGVLAASAGLLVLAIWLCWREASQPLPRTVERHALSAGWLSAPWWIRLVVLVLLALVVIRLGGLLLEVVLRPVYAWDAWYYWSYRARGFLEHGEADAFVSPWTMWRDSVDAYGQGYRHPALVSLIQLWSALALGRWHESLVNLPWFLAGVALGLLVYGYLRRLGLGIFFAMLGVYLTLSVPLAGMHIGMGGYADIWMVGAMAIAGLGLFALFTERRWQEAIVLVPAMLAMPFLKQAGILFVACVLAAFVFAALPVAWGFVLLALIVFGVVLVVLYVGLEFNIPLLGPVILEPERIVLPRGGEFALDPQWGLFFQRLVLEGSWHLLFLLSVAVVVFAVPAAWRDAAHRFAWVLVVSVGLMTFVVYAGTVEVDRLLDGTGFGRHLLPLVPVIASWAVLLCADWMGVRCDRLTVARGGK